MEQHPLSVHFLMVPQIVCYKTSSISYFIGKSFVNISFISLVNIILKKAVVKELIQNDLTEEKLKSELSNLLSGNKISNMLNAYSKIYSMLSRKETSKKIVASIVNLIPCIILTIFLF